jgi:hypothetical protein
MSMIVKKLMKKETIVLILTLALLLAQGGLSEAVDGEGMAIISPGQALQGTYDTIKIEYTVGESGISVGGGIKFYLPNWDKKGKGIIQEVNWGVPQTEYPAQQGYTTVQTSNPNVNLDLEIEEHLYPESKPSDLRYYHVIEVIVGMGNPLLSGDKVIITYGEKSLGGPGAKVQVIPKDTEFTVFTDCDGDGEYAQISKSPHVNVLGGPARDMRVVIPSVTTVNKPFDIKVLIVDANNFRASGYYNHTITFSSSDPEANLPADFTFSPEDNSAAILPGVSFSNPGIHTITVADLDTGIIQKSNPSYVAKTNLTYRIYWGDIHWHSKLSDGIRQPDEGYLSARDETFLDFTAMTDHDFYMCTELNDNWLFAQGRATFYNDPGKFVTFNAYEWTSPRYGHKNVYYYSDGQPLFPFSDGHGYLYTPDELWQELDGRHVITIPHHPAASGVSTDWSYRNTALQRLVEIASGHGVAEYYDPEYPDLTHDPVPGRFVQDALAMRHKLGIIASSDDHYTFPGRSNILVAVYSPQLTRESIFKNLWRRHTYGVTGGRIILYFSMDGHLMGEEYQTDQPPEITVLAAACDNQVTSLIEKIKKIEVVKYSKTHGYQTIVSKEFPGKGVPAYSFTYTDKEFNENSFYYVRVIQTGEKPGINGRSSRAWSSPIWVFKSE